MFENVLADLRHYSLYCYGGRPLWRTTPRILYAHPASAMVIWYRLGAFAWRLRIPVLRQVLQAVYLLCLPLVRMYSGVQLHPRTRIGPGLIILHFGGVIITEDCEIGRECVLHQNVSIVTTNYARGARIGDHFYAGAGAIITGHLVIEDNVVVGAGSVVTRSVPKDAIVAGAPARILRFRTPEERPPKVRVGHHEVASYLELPEGAQPPAEERVQRRTDSASSRQGDALGLKR